MAISLYTVRCEINVESEPWAASQVTSEFKRPTKQFMIDKNVLTETGSKLVASHYYAKEALYLAPSFVNEVMYGVIRALGDSPYELTMQCTVRKGGPEKKSSDNDTHRKGEKGDGETDP